MRMRAFLFVLALAVAAPGWSQAPAGQQPAGQQQAPPAGQEQQKQITDPTEYNVYVAAVNETNPATKIKLLDDFLAKYPNTVVKEDALVLKMSAMQQAGQNPEPAARQLLQANPNNLRALVLLSYMFINTPLSEKDPGFQQKLSEADQNARRGLQSLASFTPLGSPADAEKIKKGTEATFHQAVGVAAMGRKEFDKAQTAFRRAAELTPEDATVFYRLGNVYMLERPNPKYSEAFWAFGRAVTVDGQMALPPAGRTQVNDYLRKVYVNYHGSDEGLEQLKQQAKAQPFPPTDFKILSKAEILPPVQKMDFPEIRERLKQKDAMAEKLWQQLKGQTLALKGFVLSAAPAGKARTLRIVVTRDTAQKPNAYDIELSLTEPAPVKEGQFIEFTGIVSEYRADPDFALVMIEGVVTAGEPEKPAAKKPAAGKKAPARKRR